MSEPAAVMTEQAQRRKPGPKPGNVVPISDLKRTAKAVTEIAVSAPDPQTRLDAAGLLLELSRACGRPAWLPVEASPSEEID